jgi:hypothetical protein
MYFEHQSESHRGTFVDILDELISNIGADMLRCNYDEGSVKASTQIDRGQPPRNTIYGYSSLGPLPPMYATRFGDLEYDHFRTKHNFNVDLTNQSCLKARRS